jgi:hypothetical protein
LRYFRDNLSIGSIGFEEEFVAEQATHTVDGTGAVASPDATGTMEHGATPASGHFEHNPGRPISWIGTTIVVIGFIVGGIAFVPKPNWILFWVGTAVAIIGCFVLLFSKAMSTDWY